MARVEIQREFARVYGLTRALIDYYHTLRKP